MNPKIQQAMNLLKEVAQEQESQEAKTQFLFITQDLSNGEIDLTCCSSHESLVDLLLECKDADPNLASALNCVNNGGCTKVGDVLSDILSHKPTAQA